MRYFATVRPTGGEIVCIYRFSPDPTNYVEEIWRPSKQSWVQTKVLTEDLIYGEPTIEEITESEAKKAFPEAF